VAEAVRRADAARKAGGLWLRLWKAVRCPSDLDPWMRKAGGLWEPASRRWLIERRMGPLMRNLRRNTDPLFRRAGIELDEEG
jgi:hypothetical protein